MPFRLLHVKGERSLTIGLRDRGARRFLGETNRKYVQTQMQYFFEQELIGRRMTMEELFIDPTSA